MPLVDCVTAEPQRSIDTQREAATAARRACEAFRAQAAVAVCFWAVVTMDWNWPWNGSQTSRIVSASISPILED